MKNLTSLLFRFSLCLMVLPLLVAKSQAQTHGNKFLRSENPISGQYIVVLNGTGLSPMPEEPPSEIMSAETDSTETSDNEQTGMSKATEAADEIQPETVDMEATPLLDPELVSLAIDLTRLYGGQFVDAYGMTGKGFILRASEEEALAMSQDNRVLFVQEDGEIKIGAIQFNLPSWRVERIHRRFLPPSNSVAVAVRKSIGPGVRRLT